MIRFVNSMSGSYPEKELRFIHITKTAGTSIENTGKKNGILWGMFDKEYGTEHISWHIPFFQKNKGLKRKYDWFMVVRDPYSRILSEFHCPWLNHLINRDVDREGFNAQITNLIENRKMPGLGYHFCEQWKYVDPSHDIIINVIKFENLEEEFLTLMEKYDIDIHELSNENKGLEKRFKINDLSNGNIRLINNIYDRDFKLFNYKKLEI